MQETVTTEPTRDGLPPMPPGPPHVERHFTQNATVRDLVIGTADGLTVPFALAAALSGAVAANPLIVTAGLAEIAAGCVAMGLGGYLAARTEADHYAVERRREEEESRQYPNARSGKSPPSSTATACAAKCCTKPWRRSRATARSGWIS